MSKHFKIICFLLSIVIIVFAYSTLPLTDPPKYTQFVAHVNIRFSSTTELIDSLRFRYKDPVYHTEYLAIEEIIRRGKSHDIIEELDDATHDRDPIRTAYVTYILFRLRDNPQSRILDLIDRLKIEIECNSALPEIFGRLGPEDIEYLPLIEALLSSDNPKIVNVASIAVKQIDGNM
jgi:hypothetical protein